jgi:spore maturation protein SpmA
MSTTTVGTLCFMWLWKYVPHHTWDTGRLTSISLRQGIFFGSASSILLTFHLLGLLTWWIGVMIYGVFVLVELALEH